MESKIDRLKEILSDMDSALIAFSGGVDSSFLLRMAKDVIGQENVVALTFSAPIFPHHQYEDAKILAEELGVGFVTVNVDVFSIPHFSDNPRNRCYICKRKLYSICRKKASDINIRHVLDGSNYDDTSDFRPGMRAARELKIRSPLLEAQLSKNDIRKYSKRLGLSVWDKPSSPCLASRFPCGTSINKERLKRVHEAESFLSDMGFRIVRVRFYGELAKIEVDARDLPEILGGRKEIIPKLKSMGFSHVALDLEGYGQKGGQIG